MAVKWLGDRLSFFVVFYSEITSVYNAHFAITTYLITTELQCQLLRACVLANFSSNPGEYGSSHLQRKQTHHLQVIILSVCFK